MIPQQTERSVVAADAGEAASFGISKGDEAHLMTVLRDTLYSDKVLAVLREYGANAWDAHREAGIPEVPIEVKLPTLDDPNLEIRDRGRGLKKQEVFELFTQYGASTKRGDAGQVGMLGIGSKSGFAYADSFVIVSRCEGFARTYVATIDASERGELRLLDEVPSGETGVSICVAVKRHDVAEFVSKAHRLFSWFEPCPSGFTPAASAEQWRPAAGRKWIAVMGCVAYPVDLAQLRLPSWASRVGCALRFPIGALGVAASREQLKYGDQTREALETAITDAVDELVLCEMREVEKLSPWQQMLALRKYEHLELPLLSRKVARSHKIEGAFVLRLGRKVREEVDLDKHARIIVRDDKRGMRGFALDAADYVARHPETGKLLDAEVVRVAVRAAGCDGLPVLRTSQMQWTPPPKRERREPLPRQKRCKAYRLRELDDAGRRAWSAYWEPLGREVAKGGVYVVLNKFKFPLAQVREDQSLARALKLPFPEIVGSRKELLGGVAYAEWRKAFAAEALARTLDDLETLDWRRIVDLPTTVQLVDIVADLGGEHRVVKLLSRAAQPLKYDELTLHEVRRRCGAPDRTPKARAALDAVLSAHPLLAAASLSALWEPPHADKWLEYVKLTTKKGRKK